MKKLWLDEYSRLPVEVVEQRQLRPELSPIEAVIAEGLDSSRLRVERDEYDAWMELEPCDCDDLIAYWVSRSESYPRLARMALDVLSIPAMSSEPERIFSLAGLMVTDRRNRLHEDIIQAAQCIRSWEQHGIALEAPAVAEEPEVVG